MASRARLRAWAPAAGVWGLIAFSYTLSNYVQDRTEGMVPHLGQLLAWNLGTYGLWFLLSPAVASAARRIGFEARRWRRAVALHLPSALGFSLLHLGLLLPAYWWLMHVRLHDGRSFVQELQQAGPFLLHQDLLVYAMLVLALYAIHHRRATEAEQLRASELEGQLAQARLQALRMQLNPHFLFNTLNAISALTLEDPALAKAMIAKLGEFLRLTLEEGDRPELPLGRELHFLDCYLAIEQLRFQDRLRVELDVEPGLLDLLVPHLILQPLVENALRHGLAPRPGPGRLLVRARREGARLLLEVEDDGQGLRAGMQEGLGLANTRARLQARYGAAASLRLAPASAAGGARATLELPLP